MALTTVPASLSATALTLTTAAQPNITSVGTLTGLTVSGNIAGTLTTAAQTNITSVGTLSSLTVGGNLLPSSDSAHNIGANATRFANAYFDTMYGTVGTAAQTNITSVGTLSSLTVSGALNGTLSTAAQTNITSLGTLTGLSVTSASSTNNFISIDTTTATQHSGLLLKQAGTIKWDLYADASTSSFYITNGSAHRISITSAGNIGIKKSNPALPFHVELATSETAHFGSHLNVNTTGQYSGISLGYIDNGNTNYSKVKIVASGRGDGAARQNLNFLVDTANDGNSAVLADTKMIIDGYTGNVGIGTGNSVPQSWSRLQVTGVAGSQPSGSGAQALYINAPTTTANEGVGIRLSAASGSKEAVGIIGMVNNASGNSGSMTFHTYNAGATIPEQMRIDNTGAVMIGDTNASSHKFKVTSTTMAARFQGGNGGYSALSWTGNNGNTIGSMTTHNSLIYFGSQNTGGTGSNGEIRITPTAANILLLQSNGMKMHNLAGQSTKLELVNVDNEDNDTGRESSLRFSGFRSGGESVDHAQISGHHFTSADDDVGGLIFWTNNGSGLGQAMRLNQARRLGIGIDSPIAALSVGGTSTNTAAHLLHVYRPNGLTHTGEPHSSILLQNQETSSGYQYDGMAMFALNQTHLRFQVGNTGSWGGSGAKRWQIRVGEAAGTDRMEIYSWTGGQLQQWDGPNKAVAIMETGSRFVVGAGVSATTFYSNPPSQGAIGLFCKGSYSNCDTHVEVATQVNAGWSNIYLNRFDWVSGEDGRFIAMGINGFASDSANLTYDGTNVSIVNSSDYRLKENIVDYSGGLAKLEELRVRLFNKKEGVSKHITQAGFIAHEAAEANIPGLILGEKDAMKVNEEGETVPAYQEISTDRLIPYLVSAIQELSAEVKALKDKLGE